MFSRTTLPFNLGTLGICNCIRCVIPKFCGLDCLSMCCASMYWVPRREFSNVSWAYKWLRWAPTEVRIWHFNGDDWHKWQIFLYCVFFFFFFLGSFLHPNLISFKIRLTYYVMAGYLSYLSLFLKPLTP